MPRSARKQSVSNIYHVMLRGINRQVIFEDDGDRNYFMKVLKSCKEISGFKLHAFCLMSNHIHLLIEPGDEPLETIFKRIGVRYVYWYNLKYQRTGHLFQDRFRSENIDNNQYYMVVLRYILQNPMKAGLEICPGTFRWSSYLAYEKGAGTITDTEYALDLFGSREALIEFVRQGNDDIVMDDSNCDKRIRDDVAETIMRQITGCVSVPDFQRLGRPDRKDYVRKMYHENLSSRQISRLTGLSKTTVIRIVNDTKVFSSEANDSLTLHESSETDFYDSEEIW